MTDKEAESTLCKLLQGVSVMQGKVATPLVKNGAIMFDDIDLITLVELAQMVLELNLGNFMGRLSSLLNNQTESKTLR